VAPSGRGAPDGRAAFTYKLDPGAELPDYVGISNYSDQPITLDLYASDALTTPTGGFDLLPAAQKPTDVGTWVVFEERYRRLLIPSRSRVDVPFRITVPRNATPGDHAGGIVTSVAESGTDSDGNRVRIDPQNQVSGLLWAGWNTTEVPAGVFVNNKVTFNLTGVSGPAGFSIYTAAAGTPTVLFVGLSQWQGPARHPRRGPVGARPRQLGLRRRRHLRRHVLRHRLARRRRHSELRLQAVHLRGPRQLIDPGPRRRHVGGGHHTHYNDNRFR
jgi:hypothetical protein